MTSDIPCEICSSKDCPCPLCHGNPKKYLGGSHGGIQNSDTGAVKCRDCGAVTDRA